MVPKKCQRERSQLEKKNTTLLYTVACLVLWNVELVGGFNKNASQIGSLPEVRAVWNFQPGQNCTQKQIKTLEM